MVALPPKVACVALVAAVCALALVPAGATLPPTKIWSPWNAIYYHFDASATYAANTPSVNPPPAYFHKRLPDDGRIPAADVAAALAGNENYLYLYAGLAWLGLILCFLRLPTSLLFELPMVCLEPPFHRVITPIPSHTTTRSASCKTRWTRCATCRRATP